MKWMAWKPTSSQMRADSAMLAHVLLAWRKSAPKRIGRLVSGMRASRLLILTRAGGERAAPARMTAEAESGYRVPMRERTDGAQMPRRGESAP